MSEEAFTAGHLARLRMILGASIDKALPAIAKRFGDPEEFLRILGDKKDVLAKALETHTIDDAIKGCFTVVPRGRITLILDEPLDLPAVFQGQGGLYASKHFNSLILSKARALPPGAKLDVGFGEIGNDRMIPHVSGITDMQITTSLPTSRFFNESEICTIIAMLVSSKKWQVSGVLKRDGRANLFYTDTHAVSVLEDTDPGYSWGGPWDVRAGPQGKQWWTKGSFIFYPAD